MIDFLVNLKLEMKEISDRLDRLDNKIDDYDRKAEREIRSVVTNYRLSDEDLLSRIEKLEARHGCGKCE